METRRGSRVGKKSRFTAETRPCGPQRWLPLVVTEFCDVQRKIGRMRPRQDGGAHMLSPKGRHVLNSGQKWPNRKKWGSSVARPSKFSEERGVSFFNKVDN